MNTSASPSGRPSSEAGMTYTKPAAVLASRLGFMATVLGPARPGLTSPTCEVPRPTGPGPGLLAHIAIALLHQRDHFPLELVGELPSFRFSMDISWRIVAPSGVSTNSREVYAVQIPFTEAQIADILAQADASVPVEELVRKYGMSEVSVYAWRQKYGGLIASELRGLPACA